MRLFSVDESIREHPPCSARHSGPAAQPIRNIGGCGWLVSTRIPHCAAGYPEFSRSAYDWGEWLFRMVESTLAASADHSIFARTIKLRRQPPPRQPARSSDPTGPCAMDSPLVGAFNPPLRSDSYNSLHITHNTRIAQALTTRPGFSAGWRTTHPGQSPGPGWNSRARDATG